MPANLYQQVEVALLEKNPQIKCSAVSVLHEQWNNSELTLENSNVVLDLDQPGIPVLPKLVNPRHLKKRTLVTEKGRIHLLHAFAHIEFNAINIALDAVYRFRNMPKQYVSDWLLVASEEAKHFTLLDQYLRELASFYGDCEAHSGLWDMVCKTRHNVLHRMALVPRVMEARGLDVTPGMINRFQQANDRRAVDILRVIYEDEIGHVRIGNEWYQYCCKLQEVDATDTFQTLVNHYMGGKLRGPFNWPARIEAGFESTELQSLERLFS